MNVSIFLRQFGSVDSSVIVQWLRDADASRLGVERLRAMLRILPEPHEVQLLTPYIDKDRTRSLAPAERFYVQLIALPKYADTILIIPMVFRSGTDLIPLSLIHI